jgi:hypothetical protein
MDVIRVAAKQLGNLNIYRAYCSSPLPHSYVWMCVKIGKKKKKTNKQTKQKSP